jgi:hypothetical protein
MKLYVVSLLEHSVIEKAVTKVILSGLIPSTGELKNGNYYIYWGNLIGVNSSCVSSVAMS